METRNLHPTTSAQRFVSDNALVCFGHGHPYTEWRVSAIRNGRQSDTLEHSTRVCPYVFSRPQETKGDVLMPPLIKNITNVRGLNEVTNLEHLRESSAVRGWNDSHCSSYFPRRLPASAYTERLRTSNLGSTRCTNRLDQNVPTHWQGKYISQPDIISHELHADSHRTAAPLRSSRYDNPNVHIVSVRASTPSNVANSQLGLIHRRTAMSLIPMNCTKKSVEAIDPELIAVPDVSLRKRLHETEHVDLNASNEERIEKRSKRGMLDVLCSATLELGPIQSNPVSGCSCPRSNCIKLYCDCFKAGRQCSNICSCLNCKNTEEETKIDGERIRAIKNTLARNPRAFTGGKKEAVPQNPGDVVCNCLKSRCLKLYCQCFHKGRTCNEACLCISCLNTPVENVVGGRRNLAIQNCLEKRPDAFTKKPKAVGAGCACKNNKCLKKYCDCFRFHLSCGKKCSCKFCGNGKSDDA